VNLPAAAAVPPIAGGDARYVLNPVPLTVLLADSVVNEPVLPLMGLLVMPSDIVTAPVEFEITIGVSTEVPAGEYRRISRLPVLPACAWSNQRFDPLDWYASVAWFAPLVSLMTIEGVL
jgi:hypothetical protein